jgi:hypothetical protein
MFVFVVRVVVIGASRNDSSATRTSTIGRPFSSGAVRRANAVASLFQVHIVELDGRRVHVRVQRIHVAFVA